MNKEITLPSGAKLVIQPAPFADAKELYQAILVESKVVRFDGKESVASFVKDLICIGFSSKKIEACLVPCLKRSLYKGEKIGPETFEAIESRQDYTAVCYEVAKENVEPFMKSLYAQFERGLEMLKEKGQA